MKNNINELIKILTDSLTHQHEPISPSAFIKILFDVGESIQVKRHSYEHPADAQYVEIGSNGELLSEWVNQHSYTGVQFCTNAVPASFLEKLDYLDKVISLGQTQWDRLVPLLRDDLSLSSTMFDQGRTFFIEADALSDGKEIKSLEDKITMLKKLLESNIPISYVLDTGGRGPHIGIVLENSVKRGDFDQIVRKVMERLPSWIDCGVGRINQMERLPGTRRMNKRGETVEVRLLYLGRRVDNMTLEKWIKSKPVINANFPLRQEFDVGHLPQLLDTTEVVVAAWKFIQEHGLKSTKSIRHGKISVSCPNQADHKSGKDRNMSAFINVSKGIVWCSACQKLVGRTFEKKLKDKRMPSPLIPSSSEPVDLSTIKPFKIF
ncbi:MAG: hypothetical protein JNM39_09690 [Bdellovibrionaceae bacterium]|nr:hypothetical protein [Pseudobdellovibrionaceae bacterium]